MAKAADIDALTQAVPTIGGEQFVEDRSQRDAVQWIFWLFCHGLHTIAINAMRFNRYIPVVCTVSSLPTMLLAAQCLRHAGFGKHRRASGYVATGVTGWASGIGGAGRGTHFTGASAKADTRVTGCAAASIGGARLTRF